MRNNPHVKTIQRRLGLKVDGWFGKQTKEAVKKFQRENPACGPADGWVGPKTWNVLFKYRPPFVKDLSIGLKDSFEVKTVQKRLGLFVDGWFGRKTKAAVMEFQKRNPEVGPVTGVVDIKTWEALFR
jgi:peptidoglycan hydrolase-like protein with peptidoglycan-binding domain